MRKILFRGKRADNGAWVEGFYLNLFEESINKEESVIVFQNFEGAAMSYPYPTVNTIYAVVNERTVGQFTGFIDKNKINIFEGDKKRDKNGNICVVVFLKGSFFIECKYYREHFYSSSQFGKIIGNIHDNPELL